MKLLPQRTNGPGWYILPVTMPDIGGMYAYTITFNGASLYAPSSASGERLFISLDKTAHISLYSNPTTLALAGNGNTTFYVVVSGDAGLPIPTGSVSLEIAHTASLDANGAATINLAYTYTSLPITLYVTYSGDANYAATDARFPPTNPAIPTPAPTTASTGGTNISSGATGAATPSVGATGTLSAIAQAATTASVGVTNTVNGSATATPAAKVAASSGAGPGNPGNLGAWILGSSLLILACLGLFGFRTWRIHKQTSKAVITP